MNSVFETDLKDHKLLFRGKVRDVYDLGEHLLIVTTDRISAFDVILPDPIPGKGVVLNQLTLFWMNRFSDVVANHNSDLSLQKILDKEDGLLHERSVVVKKAKPLPIECVVRGYVIGSGWKDYQKTGEICGVPLPKGLQLAQKLPEPIFTPATKAEIGQHDENIPFEVVVQKLGKDLSGRLKTISLRLYQEAADDALQKGIIIADTKFEFGLIDNELVLIDEVLTPDSSRFWSRVDYEVGMSPPSYDKQIVRDYLETLDWNKTAPGPKLPPEVIQKTAEKYRGIQKILAVV